MKLTYRDALDTIVERTDIGYTLKSLDRLWTCHIYDTWSTDDWWGNRLYFHASGGLSYDLIDNEWVWTTYREAEAFRCDRQAYYDDQDREPDQHITVYVLNLGDDSRWENAYLGGPPHKPRFKNGQDSITERTRLWRERDARERNNA